MKKLLTLAGITGAVLAALRLRQRTSVEHDYIAPDPVDHHRQPGVPPESVDDVNGSQEDLESAQSFPASDPPGNY